MPPPDARPDRRGARRWAGALTAAVFTLARPGAARADEPDDGHHVRAALEEVGVLGAGLAEYFINAGVNARDWDLGYDWESLRKKLTGEALAFDTNRFETNWMSHSVSGYLYYQVARGNRLSLPESFAYAVAASTIWEYLGEFREQASINDLVSTPVAGMVLGETTTQLGLLFRRSRRTVPNAVLGWIFAPGRAVHDTLDGVEPETGPAFDDVGIAADVAHEFRFRVGPGLTRQRTASGEEATYGDLTLGASSRITNLRGWDRPGSSAGWFGDGNVSSLSLDASASGSRVVDASFDARVVAAGYATRDLVVDTGGRLAGGQRWFGFETAFRYDAHRYDRTRGGFDKIAMVSFGLAAENETFSGPLRVRTRLDVLGSLAGVGSLAFGSYVTTDDVERLQAVLRQQRYAFDAGLAVVPSITVALARLEVGLDARFDTFEPITWAERFATDGGAPVGGADTRTLIGGSLGWTFGSHVHPRLWARRLERSSRIGGTHARAEESSVGAALELRL